MTEAKDIEAWNNFVMHSDHSDYDIGDERRDAAIAARYMSLANNGGLNYLLTYTYDLDSPEILQALSNIGAHIAAAQFEHLLNLLGEPLPKCSEDVRWETLDRLWTEELDDFETLTPEADQDLVSTLEKHVAKHQAYYLSDKFGDKGSGS